MTDFVYILKEDDKNPELQYSLRSIAKFYPNNKVWVVGYKPNWLQNVNYIPVKQSEDKWQNSINNIIEACKCPDISEDFILMNDDFIILEDKLSLETVCNISLGELDKNYMAKCKSLGGPWYAAFPLVNDLLKELNIEKPYYNYDSHLPILINKSKYLEVMALPEVQKFIRSNQILHKRTLYKNINKPLDTSNMLKEDVKILASKDNTKDKINICGWISVSDNQIGSSQYVVLNSILHTNFPIACKYEDINVLNKNPAHLQRIVTTNTRPKNRFIYF